MKIGIDARALTGRYTGDRTYWLNLVRAHVAAAHQDKDAANQYLLYSRVPIDSSILPESQYLTYRVIPASSDRLWTISAFPKALRMDNVDIAHTQYTTPLRTHCPLVTTVHDISFRLFPEWFPRKHRILLNLTVPGAMRRADLVITDSFSSRKDILRVYRLPETKVVAIHLAAGIEYAPVDKLVALTIAREKYKIDKPYILSVSVLQPRKNLPLLIEAFAKAVKSSNIPHMLVLTGKKGWGYDNLLKMASQFGISDRLILTDYVPDEDLPALYSGADLVAYPSLYEGFGLPPVEAMACGTPVIVSNAPCMPEIAGSGALVLPTIDSSPWAKAFVELIKNPKQRLEWANAGLLRSKDFDWVRTAAETRYHYERVVANRITK